MLVTFAQAQLHWPLQLASCLLETQGLHYQQWAHCSSAAPCCHYDTLAALAHFVECLKAVSLISEFIGRGNSGTKLGSDQAVVAGAVIVCSLVGLSCSCLQVKRSLKGRAQCQTMWGHTMYHPEDVPYKADMSDLPDTFTPARHKVKKRVLRVLYRT